MRRMCSHSTWPERTGNENRTLFLAHVWENLTSRLPKKERVDSESGPFPILEVFKHRLNYMCQHRKT